MILVTRRKHKHQIAILIVDKISIKKCITIQNA